MPTTDSNTIYAIIDIAIKIARKIVDFIIAFANGDFSGLEGLLPNAN